MYYTFIYVIKMTYRIYVVKLIILKIKCVREDLLIQDYRDRLSAILSLPPFPLHVHLAQRAAQFGFCLFPLIFLHGLQLSRVRSSSKHAHLNHNGIIIIGGFAIY